MKKRIITEEEYQDITTKLKKTNEEINYLNKIILFQQNLNNEVDPNELILYLKRNNQELDKIINIETKKFIAPYQTSKILYQKLKLKLEKLYIELETSIKTQNKPQKNTLSYFSNYHNFDYFLEQIQINLQKKENNIQLIIQLNNLLNKQSELLVLKKEYQKQRKKLIKHKK